MPILSINNAPAFHISKGTRLIDILHKRGISIFASCGGHGYCGSCRVKIVGRANPPDARERTFISPRLLKEGYRLACRYHVTRNTILDIAAPVSSMVPATAAHMGLALDLGTTVLKGALVDLHTQQILNITKIYNPQNRFGGDVMTRIGLALQGKYKQLHERLLAGIKEIQNDLGVKKPGFSVVTGNPVMSSFYLGKPVKTLARYPYQSAITKGIMYTKPKRYIFGSIGGFVGGDAIAGIMASGILNNSGTSLYIDLGTNGEVALITKKRILALSTAAGPAFEGAGLKCGSLAVPGAIDRIEYRAGFKIHTIAGDKPTGICASGLIDLIAVLLETGYINERGQLHKDVKIKGIKVYQEDIRKLQLAAAAIQTGIRVLLEKTGVHPRKIKETVITGEFGSNLNTASLKRVGIIPDGLSSVRFEKDLPLRGGIMVLIDPHKITNAKKIQQLSRHVELALYPGFQNRFLKALRLGTWS